MLYFLQGFAGSLRTYPISFRKGSETVQAAFVHPKEISAMFFEAL